MWAALLLESYLKGTKLTIRIDHDSFKRIPNSEDVTGLLVRWRLLLSELDFDTIYRAGIVNLVADPLLRLETKGEDNPDIIDYISVAVIDRIEDMSEEGEVSSYTVR